MGERIFAGDWRACQEEHLRAVVAAGDARNEAALVQLLQEIGFDAGRLTALGVAADAGETVEAASEHPQPALTEVDRPPANAMEEASDPADVRPADEPGLPDDEPDQVGDEVPDEGDDAGPAQLSLF